ncbi:MAG: hypothetical protein AAFQ94_05745 [Bacteroidota bacterium]
MDEVTQYLRNSDAVMEEIIDTIQLPASDSSEDVFFDLVSCVLEQQIHYRARGVYLKKFMVLTGDQLPTPAIIQSLDPHEFALQKIAANKLKALQHLALYWENHSLEAIDWQNCSNEEVINHLEPIKGIGRWTIDMILLYTLGRPDIFSPSDFQLKKAMKTCYGLADDKNLMSEMTAIAERWKPYRSLATRYLLEWNKYLKKR